MMKFNMTYKFPENPDHKAAGIEVEASYVSEHFIIHPTLGCKGLSLTHRPTGGRVASASSTGKAKYLRAVAMALEATGMPWEADGRAIYQASGGNPCRNWMIELSRSIL